MRVTRTIEWPPGTGVRAEYTGEEERVLRAFLEGAQAGDLSVEQFQREVGVFHDLKALLGARLIPDALAVQAEPYEFPDPDSPFQIPTAAIEQLERFGPQTRLDVPEPEPVYAQMTELAGESWEDAFGPREP